MNNAQEKTLLEIVEAYKAAVFAKDVDAFSALYAQDVRVFDLWGEWFYQGIAAWRGMATKWFGSLGTDRVVVEVNSIHTLVTPDLAVLHAFMIFRGMSAEGKELRSMHNRLTWTLQPKDSGWKIVHEHTSAPISGDTLKAILQR